jgi:hypothetical protein
MKPNNATERIRLLLRTCQERAALDAIAFVHAGLGSSIYLRRKYGTSKDQESSEEATPTKVVEGKDEAGRSLDVFLRY